MSRETRRRALGGKRELRRRYRQDVARIIELADEGRSVKAIAQSVRVPVDFVELVLEEAARAREKEGEGVSVERPV